MIIVIQLNSYLVADAALFHFKRARNVVEVLAESCVLPVVYSLARRRTRLKARWCTESSWWDGVQRLIGWRHPAEKFTHLWFHPLKIGRLPWPRRVGHQQEDEVEKAAHNQETHVGYAVVLSELACWKQRNKLPLLTNYYPMIVMFSYKKSKFIFAK